MLIIAVGTLREFWLSADRADSEQPLRTWVRVVRAANWRNPPEVKRTFNAADILRDGRVVFDIGRNKYRLVAWIDYAYGVVYVQFIGTHAEYDKIDAQSV